MTDAQGIITLIDKWMENLERYRAGTVEKMKELPNEASPSTRAFLMATDQALTGVINSWKDTKESIVLH